MPAALEIAMTMLVKRPERTTPEYRSRSGHSPVRPSPFGAVQSARRGRPTGSFPRQFRPFAPATGPPIMGGHHGSYSPYPARRAPSPSRT